MSQAEATCLIRQSDCGLQAGQTACPKCGMRTDARYVSKEDMDTALATANATWQIVDKSEQLNRSKIGPNKPEAALKHKHVRATELSRPKAEAILGTKGLSQILLDQPFVWLFACLLVLIVGLGWAAYLHRAEIQLDEKVAVTDDDRTLKRVREICKGHPEIAEYFVHPEEICDDFKFARWIRIDAAITAGTIFGIASAYIIRSRRRNRRESEAAERPTETAP